MINPISLSPEQILRKEFIEKYIPQKMNPELQFTDLFPHYNLNGATTFKYFYDDTSAEDDIQKGVMTEPLEMTELSKLTKLEVSSINSDLGDVYHFGYSFDFSAKQARENGFVDEVLRAFDRAAYGMARKINLDTFNCMDTFASATPITLNGGAWNSSDEIPDDIIDMKHSFEDVQGWNYSLTDMFVASDQYREVEKYYKAVDTFNPSDVEGVNFTNCKTLVSSGTAYAIDKNQKPISIYYNLDSDHGTAGSLVNVNITKEDRFPYTSHVEFYCEMGIASKVPKAMLKQTGL